MPAPHGPDTVASLGEFGLIAAVTALLPQSGLVLLGPGDDAAVVAAPDARVVVTTDLLVEGVHFRRDWSSAEDVGRKAAAQNLADIAAMGAVPTAVVVGLAAPPELPTDWALALTAGLRAECDVVGASVVGGDVVRSAAGVTVAVTALGSLEGRAPLTRGGARPGDVVAVAGRLGWSAAGLAVLRRGFRSPRVLVEAHRRPEPPYPAGPEAARAGADAMVDVSDGLVQDLRHVAVASGVRITLDSTAFDVTEAMQAAGAAMGVDPLGWVLGGGEDHALAATFPPGTALGPHWRIVGAVEAVGDAAVGDAAVGDAAVGKAAVGKAEPEVLVDGAPWDAGGHDHFRGAS